MSKEKKSAAADVTETGGNHQRMLESVLGKSAMAEMQQAVANHQRMLESVTPTVAEAQKAVTDRQRMLESVLGKSAKAEMQQAVANRQRMLEMLTKAGWFQDLAERVERRFKWELIEKEGSEQSTELLALRDSVRKLQEVDPEERPDSYAFQAFIFGALLSMVSIRLKEPSLFSLFWGEVANLSEAVGRDMAEKVKSEEQKSRRGKRDKWANTLRNWLFENRETLCIGGGTVRSRAIRLLDEAKKERERADGSSWKDDEPAMKWLQQEITKIRKNEEPYCNM